MEPLKVVPPDGLCGNAYNKKEVAKLLTYDGQVIDPTAYML